MAFLKKDINFILLALILGIIIIFIGFTVYYQTMFENVSVNYQEKVANLEQVTQELGIQKTRLNQTSYELEIKEQKETDLSGRYSELRDEKTQLLEDKAALGREISEKKVELIESQIELAKKSNLLTQTQNDLSEANQNIAILRADLRSYRSKYETCQAQLDALQ